MDLAPVSWRPLLLRGLGAYMRVAPDHPGRWRLIQPAVALAPALKELRGSRTIRVREGFRMQVDGSSQTGRILYATGEYESATSAVVKRLLGAGDTMIDVGANIGYFSILGARAVGPRGSVVSFEPVGAVRERLAANVRANRLNNVSIRGEALAAAGGDRVMYTGPADDTGLASLRPLDNSSQIRVPTVPFDHIWDSARPVRLVKIDVEGGELSVLQGMAATLATQKPHLIVEITDQYLRGCGASAAALVAFLVDLGYSMYEIAHHGLVRLDAAETGRRRDQFNALFTTAHLDARP